MASLISLEPPPLHQHEPDHMEGYKLEIVDDDSEIVRCIKKDFQTAKLRVDRISKLNSNYAWTKYQKETEKMKARKPQSYDFELNEKYLYHGTKAEKERLYVEGFDTTLASGGLFGKGIYFSDNPAKCAKYADDLIFVARVLLGTVKEYEKGEKDTKLVREPEKTQPYQGWRYYDSVKGQPKDFTEYVIYRKDNACIEYVINFSKEDSNGQKVKGDAPQGKNTPIENDGPTDSRSSSDDDYDSADEDNGSVYSSDDNESDGKNNVESDDENLSRNMALLFADSVIPYFELPDGILTLEEKKKTYTDITMEEDDNEVEKILRETDEDLERAVFLFFAYKQVKEEEEKRAAGEFEEYEVEDDGSPIFPLMDPLYESDDWKKLNDEEKSAKTEEMINQFMLITAITEFHKDLAKDYCLNAKYNLDDAVISYYTSWM